jgi:hypothetical protein
MAVLTGVVTVIAVLPRKVLRRLPRLLDSAPLDTAFGPTIGVFGAVVYHQSVRCQAVNPRADARADARAGVTGAR